MDRFWQGDTPTEPMPIIDRLRHTPYRMVVARAEAARAEAEQHAVEEKSAAEAMDLALRIGELMLRCGAAAAKVETSIVALGASAGLQRLDVDITLQSLLMQCVLSDGTTITRLRVVQSSRQDFARLDAIHRLVDEVATEGWDPASVRKRLRVIQTHRRNYPDWMVLVSTGIFAAAVTFMLGAGLLATFITMLSGMAVHRTTRFFGDHGYPEFYQNAFGAFLATLIAWLVYVVGVQTPVPLSGADFAYMVAGGIVVLLPGRATAAAVEDVISGYQVTGAGRILAVFLNTAGLTIGVGAALSVTFAAVGWLDGRFVSPEILDLRSFASPTVPAVVGAFFLGTFASVTLQSRRRLLVPIGLLCVLAVLISRVLTDVAGLGITIASGAAAVVLGVLGRLLASRLGSLPMTIIIPASFGLLPGLAIFRGLYEMAASHPSLAELSVQSGITTLLGAFATLLAIATGTMLGEIAVGPAGHRLSRARWDKRRRRQG